MDPNGYRGPLSRRVHGAGGSNLFGGGNNDN
jgi:hypothetical protein